MVLSTFVGEQKQIQGAGGTQNNGVLNPVYTKWKVKILSLEVELKSLLLKKTSLIQKMKEFGEADASTANQKVMSSENKQKINQLKIIEDNLKQYESKFSELESQHSKQKLDDNAMAQEEATFARLYNSSLVKYENQKLLFRAPVTRSLDFKNSVLEPVIFLGTPMRRIIFIAFGCGLIFTILVTLIKSNLGNKMKKSIVNQENAQYVDVSSDDIVDTELSFEKEKMAGLQS